jgi:co-chaperonin GroES (HSP10)
MRPKTATIMVIAVGPGGHHRKGGAPLSHSACGCEEADNNAPMIAIPVEALSTDMEDGQQAMPEVGDEVLLDDVRGILKKLDNGEAYIEIKSVNGMPAEYENKDEKAMASKEPMDENGMRKMVEEYDSEMGS